MNEVSGWKLEDEDLTLVNSESDGDKLYIVRMWWGSGYMTDNYNAYAHGAEEALNHVVAYIEKTDPDKFKASDECATDYLNDLVKDGEAASIEEAYEHPYFQETFMYVDATAEGAKEPHYIWAENLEIAEYPKDHDYPMAKGVKRRMDEHSDNDYLRWHDVTNAFDEFRQKLWEYTRHDRKGRKDAFSRCMNSMERAMREFYNDAVYEGDD